MFVDYIKKIFNPKNSFNSKNSFVVYDSIQEEIELLKNMCRTSEYFSRRTALLTRIKYEILSNATPTIINLRQKALNELKK